MTYLQEAVDSMNWDNLETRGEDVTEDKERAEKKTKQVQAAQALSQCIPACLWRDIISYFAPTTSSSS